MTFLSRQKGNPKRRSEHQLPRYFAQALRLPICLQLHRDRTRHRRAGPLQLASHRSGRHTLSSRWKSGPIAPVGTGFRRCDRGGASERSELCPAARATGRRAQRSRRSSHTRARLRRATRGSPSGGPARQRR